MLDYSRQTGKKISTRGIKKLAFATIPLLTENISQK